LKEAQYLTVPASTALCHVIQLDLSFSNSSLLLLANHTLLHSVAVISLTELHRKFTEGRNVTSHNLMFF